MKHIVRQSSRQQENGKIKKAGRFAAGFRLRRPCSPERWRHLDGGIRDDQKWQSRWLRLVQIAPTRYTVPKGKVGKRFLVQLTLEFQGARERKWNSERPLVFAATILQTTPGVRRSQDIRRRLARRMDLWDQGCFSALVDDTEVEIRSRFASPRPLSDDAKARAFNAKVLSGRLQSACRNLTSSDGGGVLQPDDKCTKSGRPVIGVLQGKHPDLREPPSVGTETGAFEPYGSVPTSIPVDITAQDVESVASRLSGAAGPGGTDAVDLRNWLLRFGKESEALREEMALWASWLANGQPPWAAYRALMAARLVALDKQPGVRPVGIGEVYRRLFAKVLLKVIGSQATAACGNYNLCAGLLAGIEGAVHAVREIYEEQSSAAAHPESDEAEEEQDDDMPSLLPRTDGATQPPFDTPPAEAEQMESDEVSDPPARPSQRPDFQSAAATQLPLGTQPEAASQPEARLYTQPGDRAA